MKPKLTKPQKDLLKSLTEDHEVGTYVELYQNEMRTALALEKKGLIELHGDRTCARLVTPKKVQITTRDLKQQFKKEVGIDWENSQGEPDIEYVWWLEQQIINDKGQSDET